MQVTDIRLDTLSSHPSQTIFTDLAGVEWEELVEDVRARGIQQPITVSARTGRPVIVDGHQRVRAAREAGLTSIPAVQQPYADERAETLALVMANIRRRHLSREERRAVIAEMLKLYPEKSNRQHAESLGVSHNTVKAERESLESLGQIAQVDRVTTSDGKSRPATQVPSRPPAPSPAAERLARNMAGNAPAYEPRTQLPAPVVPEPQPVSPPVRSQAWLDGLPAEVQDVLGKTDEELIAEDREAGWEGPPPPDDQSVRDAALAPRVNALSKVLAQLLKFRAEGPELLQHPDARVLALGGLVHYVRDMTGEWLGLEPEQPTQKPAEAAAKALN